MQMDDLGRERKREVGVGARTRVRIRWGGFGGGVESSDNSQ